jgi:hypothetical protein
MVTSKGSSAFRGLKRSEQKKSDYKGGKKNRLYGRGEQILSLTE